MITGGYVRTQAVHATSAESELHCFYARDPQEFERKGQYLYSQYGDFLNHERVVELGCGEGAFLAWIQKHTSKDAIGVDSNAELCALARSHGVRVQNVDLLEYLEHHSGPAAFLYLDVIEHVSSSTNFRVFECIPRGSRLIIQTPYTKSLKGHEFYMNVPSHVAPYSPEVIAKMLHRTGYRVVAEGTIEGHHPPTWKNRARAWFIRKVLGIDPELLLGGGNYFVVADRTKGAA